MNTLTTIESVEAKDSSWVATLLGGKKAGTTDPATGAKLLEIFNRDPENCLAEVELEKRGERLWLLSVDYIEAPPELGGPAEPYDAPGIPGDPPSVPPAEAVSDLAAVRTAITEARVALGEAMTLIEKLL